MAAREAPAAKSLAGKARETRPTRQLALESEWGRVCFALAADGTVTVAEELEHRKTAVCRWAATGERVARVLLRVSVTDLALAGTRVVLAVDDGGLSTLDETLVETKRARAHRERTVTVRSSRDGDFVVSTSEKGLAVFDTAALKRLASVAVKDSTTSAPTA